MDTLKTAVVVVLLLAVLYGVYVVLNKPEPLSQDLAWPDQAGDPGVQIELGLPEPGIASSGPGEIPVRPQAQPGEHSETALPSTPLGRSVLPNSAASTEIAAPELLVADNSEEAARNRSEAGLAASAPNQAASSPGLATPEADATVEEPLTPKTSLEAIAPTEPTTTAPEGSRDGASANVEVRQASTVEVSNASVEEQTIAAAPPNLDRVLKSVRDQIAEAQWYEALLKASHHYSNHDLTSEEREQLLALLDPLAGKVVYSTEHLVDEPHSIQRGESLFTIAEQYQVPWQLLANINGVENPEVLVPGTRLKILRGPFRAEVSIPRNELTLFVGKLYAGRFPITIGNDPMPQPGEYDVKDKQPGRTYYAGDGRTVAIDDPTNPYGGVWLDLGSDFSLHGSSEAGLSNSSGCISLSPRDARDVYGILSKGSKVSILR